MTSGSGMLDFATDDLRVQLALAGTALMFGQTREVREKAILGINDIKTELERRGEKVGA